MQKDIDTCNKVHHCRDMTETNQSKTAERKPELRDWDKAHKLGKRAFYEHSTQTIRACPENYCLAHRDPGSQVKQPAWKRYGNDNTTRKWWQAIDRVLNTYGRWSTGDAIATAIGKAISLDSNPLDGETVGFQGDNMDY